MKSLPLHKYEKKHTPLCLIVGGGGGGQIAWKKFKFI